MMERLKIHILYEYGEDIRPHGSAFIRLLRPLTHPVFAKQLAVSSGINYEGEPVDAVIVDRLWRPDISPDLAKELLSTIRSAGSQFIYALDDNFLDLPARQLDLVSETKAWPTEDHLWVVRFFLQQADGVIVTTQPLKKRFARYNSNIMVVPNMLDERLLIAPAPADIQPFNNRRLTIGYMGTLTHDDDLLMILPALQEMWRRYPDQFEFQLVGGIGRSETLEILKDIPIRSMDPLPGEIEYPLFMIWFSSRLKWDIALAPLQDTHFTESKSDIKFLDYGAIGATGVYSRIPVYQESVRHLETGWLAENTPEAWIEALDALITQSDLRQQLAQNAAQYLYNERIVPCRADDWLTALTQMVER